MSYGSVQSLSCVRLFVTPWTVECQASLSITNSWSLLKLVSIESVMLSTHLCHPLLLPPSIFPSIRVFSHESIHLSQWVSSGGQSIGASGSTSVLPMNIQGLFPLGLAWSLCCPRDSEESFSAPQSENINSSWFRRGMSSDETTSHSLLVTACVRTDFLPNIFVVRREEVYKLTW